MRTDVEIAGRIEELQGEEWEDLDGRRCSRLLSLLPFSLAQRWLEPGVTGAEWPPLDSSGIKARCQQDFGFAWEKALGHRGISAGMMAEVMKDWVWVLGSQQDYERILKAPYENYGVPILMLAGQLLGLEAKLSPSESLMAERMAKGELCRPGCEDGCGR